MATTSCTTCATAKTRPSTPRAWSSGSNNPSGPNAPCAPDTFKGWDVTTHQEHRHEVVHKYVYMVALLVLYASPSYFLVREIVRTVVTERAGSAVGLSFVYAYMTVIFFAARVRVQDTAATAGHKHRAPAGPGAHRMTETRSRPLPPDRPAVLGARAVARTHHARDAGLLLARTPPRQRQPQRPHQLCRRSRRRPPRSPAPRAGPRGTRTRPRARTAGSAARRRSGAPRRTRGSARPAPARSCTAPRCARLSPPQLGHAHLTQRPRALRRAEEEPPPKPGRPRVDGREQLVAELRAVWGTGAPPASPRAARPRAPAPPGAPRATPARGRGTRGSARAGPRPPRAESACPPSRPTRAPGPASARISWTRSADANTSAAAMPGSLVHRACVRS